MRGDRYDWQMDMYLQKVKRARERAFLILLFGNACWDCGSTENLEFAHLRHTGLNSSGRGSNERARDVIRNIGCYMLLCHSCHIVFDSRAEREVMPTWEEMDREAVEMGFMEN